MRPTKLEHLSVMGIAEGGHETATQNHSARLQNPCIERNTFSAVGEQCRPTRALYWVGERIAALGLKEMLDCRDVMWRMRRHQLRKASEKLNRGTAGDVQTSVSKAGPLGQFGSSNKPDNRVC